MNKRLIGLIISAVILPLIVFVGNLKVEVPEANADIEPAKTEAGGEAFLAAPELAGISAWINSEPLTIAELRDKVVLVDFWTYTCINCIRTLPYLTMWQEKYSDKGLVILGIHSPEFDFEKDLENVKKAVAKYSIKYPVALDNDHSTWKAFRNNYWPHKYLIDINGKIRYNHVGEGAYDRTEKAIQELLKERAEEMRQKLTIPEDVSQPGNVIGVDFASIATPEIYFGYSFARVNLGNEEGFRPEAVVSYKAPQSYDEIAPNTAYVGGQWRNNADSLELVSDEGRIALKYTAKSVNIVASPSPGQQSSLLQVLVDEKLVNSTNRGSDVKVTKADALVTVDEQRLYSLVAGSDYRTRVIEINVKGKGFRIYTFTFG